VRFAASSLRLALSGLIRALSGGAHNDSSHLTAPMPAGQTRLADSHSRTRCKHFAGRHHQLSRNLWDIRLVVGTVERVLLTCGCAETTYASRVCYLAEDVGRGEDIELSPAECYRYSHIRVARDYHLQGNQLATLTANTVKSVLVYRSVFCRWAQPGISL
jgi:hypothetical protein